MAGNDQKILVSLILNDKDFKKGIKDSVKETGKLEDKGKKSTQTLSNGFKAVAGAIAAMGILQLGKDMQNLAAQSQGVQSAFKNSFSNAPETLKSMKEATGGTVSNLSLMQKALNAKNLKIPVDTLNAGLKLARQRAAETGESVEFLAQSVVLGLGRESALILDNLGISAKRLAEETAKTGDFMKAAADIINTELKNAPPTITTLADAIGQTNAEIENMKEELALQLTPVFQMLQKEAMTFLNILRDAFDLDKEFKFQKRMADAAGSVHKEAQLLAKGMNDLLGKDGAIDHFNSQIQKFSKTLENAPILDPNATKEQREEFFKLSDAYNSANQEVEKYILALQYMKAEVDKSPGAIEALNKKIATQKELINAAAEKDLPALNWQLQLMQERLSKLQSIGTITLPKHSTDTLAPIMPGDTSSMGVSEGSGRDPVGEIKKVKIALEEVNQDLITSEMLANTFADSFASAFVNAASAGDSFGDFMDNMLTNLTAQIAQTLIKAALLQAILGGVTGGGSIVAGGAVSSVFGAGFGGGFGGGNMNLNSTIRGNDIYLSNNRTGRNRGR